MRLSPDTRLAILLSHPIQYYAPWFRYLQQELGITLKVFYLSEAGSQPVYDPGFGKTLAWDIDLLSGYEHVFLANGAGQPGLDRFWGLNHPGASREILAWQPGVILLINYPYATHLRVAASRRLRGVPMLFRGDSHLLAEQLAWPKKGLKRLFLYCLFRRFQAFLAVGQANTRYFLRHGVPARKIFFAPHAVDLARFTESEGVHAEATRWRKELGIPENQVVILFSGKLEEKKRPHDLLHAFLQLNPPQASLLLVGEGRLKAELVRAAEAHPRIHFVPFQNQSAMPKVYAAADLVVLPSQGPGETWGLTINEALGLAKPVIVSDHVGCQEDLVIQGENGLVFPAGDTAALTGALREALTDRDRLRRWGQRGWALVQNFGYRQTTAGLRRALESLPEPK